MLALNSHEILTRLRFSHEIPMRVQWSHEILTRFSGDSHEILMSLTRFPQVKETDHDLKMEHSACGQKEVDL